MKTRKFLFAALAAMLAFASCEKADPNGDDSQDPVVVTFDGDYWVTATKDDVTKVMMPLAESKNYGYANSEDFTGTSYAENVFKLTSVEGGYTIQDANGRYYSQEAGTTYKTFNAGTDSSLAGCVWTVTKNEDGTYTIVNAASNKQIRYGEGTYTSFGVYAEEEFNGSVAVNLVPAENAAARPVLSLAKLSDSVADDVTTYTIAVTSNLSWTAAASENVTLDKTSGEGNGEVVMTFAANQTTAAVEHTVTFTAGDITKTFKLTQNAPAAANTTVITLDVRTATPCEGFATDYVKTETTYTIDGYVWTFNCASNGFKYVSTGAPYIIFGKKDAYIGLPAVEGKALKKVEILTGTGASTSVTAGVFAADGTAVKGGESITLNAKNSTFTYNLSGTAAATSYRLTVTNDKNAQAQMLTLTYE